VCNDVQHQWCYSLCINLLGNDTKVNLTAWLLCLLVNYRGQKRLLLLLLLLLSTWHKLAN
jgi:hypothetical protein